jgi:alpha-galactosidase
MNAATKNILLNKDAIAINQDALGKQAERKIHTDTLDVFVKPLAGGDIGLAILNRSDVAQTFNLSFHLLDLYGMYTIDDVWVAEKKIKKGKKWKALLQSHETKLLRLSKIK